MTKPLPLAFRAQKFLAGMRYPARKAEILAHALERAADEEVLAVLLALPDATFATPAALSTEIGRLATPRRP